MARRPQCHKKQHLLTGLIKENNSNQYCLPATTVLTSILISSLFNPSLDIHGYLRDTWVKLYATLYLWAVQRQNN